MKIKFQQYTNSEIQLLKPIPALSSLPNWYKKMDTFVNEEKRPKWFPDGTINVTVKRCNPVGDALGAGYFLLLENDIYFEKHKSGEPGYVWHRGGDNYVSTHSKSQISPDLIPKGFSGQPLKFRNDWSIQTPNGYSVLVTHPLNRNAEPFLTLSGIVDTDSYHSSIQLPFLIRSDFEGIIESGTPIAQVIPFKRESWKSEFLEYSKEFFDKKDAEFRRTMNRFYKRFHWKRKEYK